jgi:membrane-bound lytic murein transglycosylase C
MTRDFECFWKTAAAGAAFAAGAFLLFSSCTPGEAMRVGRIAISGDVASAQRMAADKAYGYAANPKTLERDLKRLGKLLEAFKKAVVGEWGTDEVEAPTPKKYVKYTQNYRSRALVDFDTGVVTVETVVADNPSQSLKNAVVTTLLAPYDPRAVDMYNAATTKLGDTPFLYNEVHDHDGKPIRWTWRAERYADHLIRNRLQQRTVRVKADEKTVHAVSFSMVKDHLHVRANKYRPNVDGQSRRFNISGNLIFAIIKTESNFNPYAVSHAPAYGLMQVVPSTAGKDVNRLLGRPGAPSPDTLLDAAANIEYGTAYLYLLDSQYLARIGNPISREYCTIAAYNAGAGTVFKTFSADRSRALDVINRTPPLEVYQKLRSSMPSAEGRRYLGKVITAKKEFINF